MTRDEARVEPWRRPLMASITDLIPPSLEVVMEAYSSSVQRSPVAVGAHRLVSVMGTANRARVDIMGGPDRGVRFYVMGGPDWSPRVDVMGESDPRLVDFLFAGTRTDRWHATVPRALHARHPSQVGSVEPTPAPTYAD